MDNWSCRIVDKAIEAQAVQHYGVHFFKDNYVGKYRVNLNAEPISCWNKFNSTVVAQKHYCIDK